MLGSLPYDDGANIFTYISFIHIHFRMFNGAICPSSPHTLQANLSSRDFCLHASVWTAYSLHLLHPLSPSVSVSPLFFFFCLKPLFPGFCVFFLFFFFVFLPHSADACLPVISSGKVKGDKRRLKAFLPRHPALVLPLRTLLVF